MSDPLLTLMLVDFAILFYSSYQDIKYKSIDDFVIYLFFIFNISYTLYLVLILNVFPTNIFLSILIILFFYSLYLFRL
ncbi:MAG: hypothetical protein ACPLX8_01200, partial [Nanopusillaceae archaeon]